MTSRPGLSRRRDNTGTLKSHGKEPEAKQPSAKDAKNAKNAKKAKKAENV
jgi:hypothetical protein